MNTNSRIYVAGSRGLVGSALVRKLKESGYQNIVERTSQELDLRDVPAVSKFFQQERSEYVFLAAAKVGGIHANSTYPADFIYDNILIETSVIHAAFEHKIKKLLFLGSSCIYPKLAPQPLKEEYLLTGELEPTNEAYAIAKIAGIKLCQAYHRQYGANFIAVMPTNLYGMNDNFDLQNSHVLPALLRKFHNATINKETSVTVWGTGQPRREFLFIDDLAEACCFLMKHYNEPDIINIGTGTDVTITELAAVIADVTSYTGSICYDLTKPDGTPVKRLDVSRINALGWTAKTGLREGIERTYDWYLRTYWKS